MIKKIFNDIKRLDKILLICSLILFIIGLIMVFSASNVTSSVKLNNPNYYFYRHLFFLSIGLISSIIAILVNSKYYGIISWPLIVVFIVMLIIVLLRNETVNNAKSWLPLFGGFKFQPSEFIKIISIVWMAHLCCGISKLKLWIRYASLILAVGLITVLIAIQPDLGTALIYFCIIFCMFLTLTKTNKTKKILIISIIGVLLVGTIFLTTTNKAEFLINRITSRLDFTNPCSEEKFYTTGTQLCNGYIAFNNGGLFGVGLGNSTQKYLYLPEAYSDFIFAIVVEELGFLLSFVILLLMFICLWRIYLVARSANTAYRRIICYGVFWYIFIHIVINLMGVTGLMPLTGVPLPFLSYGGSFLICLFTSLGIVQRIHIETMYEKNK